MTKKDSLLSWPWSNDLHVVFFSGTRIFYQRDFLMQCKNSPLAKTPPANMANIPGVTSPGEVDIPKENGVTPLKSEKGKFSSFL